MRFKIIRENIRLEQLHVPTRVNINHLEKKKHFLTFLNTLK